MRTPQTFTATLAGLVLLVAGSARGESYYLTRVDVTRLPGSSAEVKATGYADPLPFVVLENTSARAARCRVDFSTGPVPVDSVEHTVPAGKRRIERSPVAGAVGVIDVGVDCRLV